MDTPPLIDVSLRKERQELQPQSLLQQELGNVETCTGLHAASGRHCSSDKVRSTQGLTVVSNTLSLCALSQHNNHCPLLDHCRWVTCRLLPKTLQTHEIAF